MTGCDRYRAWLNQILKESNSETCMFSNPIGTSLNIALHQSPITAVSYPEFLRILGNFGDSRFTFRTSFFDGNI